VISANVLLWVGFNLFVLLMLAVDLGVFHRREHVVTVREALAWTAVWVALALIFNVVLYFWRGPETALEFLTGYVIEKSLSLDNIFVFLLIFTYFGVSPVHQHRVLFWGILGALVMRAAFIAAGVGLIQRFHWVIYVFGGFLIITGIKMAVQKDREVHPERNPVLKLFKRFFPVSARYEGGRFFVKENGQRLATPLFIVLLVVETTDVIFAVDSIPAILAITLDPFIVYTSNVFAILGLRALYFALAGVMRMFHYLHYGLSLVLVFVGIKMVIADFYKIPIVVALGVVALTIVVSILASIALPRPVEPDSSAGK